MLSIRRIIVVLLWYTSLAPSVRADLVLTNYSSTAVMKVMSIGDSITDDCSVNGAWRAPLQPLLETNGFPFNFVGRQVSSPSGTFTKVHHEGYCGAVIAPPGYFGAHGYSDVNGDLEYIMHDSLAVTSNLPNLVLLLIGANDIGRGRDPWFVATNDMPNLLNQIFSNAPNANIILCKITSLQSANISGLTYVNYATNVPIYNAALQYMVNQLRAQGENVSLADMFSVVDFATGFMSDHVHPNTTGLKAMAKELLSRIQAITIQTNSVNTLLIHGGDQWTYSDTGTDYGTNWSQPGFDDSGWSNGVGRLGYGETFDATTVGFGSAPLNKYITTYFRHAFVVPDNVAYTNFNFRLSYADGAAVWLNGQEIFQTNLPGGPVNFTNLALSSRSGFISPLYFQTNIPVSAPQTGTNLIAVEVHLYSPTKASMGFDLELLGSGNFIPPPTLAPAFTGTNLVLSWPALGSVGYNLYSTTNLSLAGGWSQAPAVTQTNNGQISVTISPDPTTTFFRLQKP